jgi:hypothetical protein
LRGLLSLFIESASSSRNVFHFDVPVDGGRGASARDLTLLAGSITGNAELARTLNGQSPAKSGVEVRLPHRVAGAGIAVIERMDGARALVVPTMAACPLV